MNNIKDCVKINVRKFLNVPFFFEVNLQNGQTDYKTKVFL